MVCCVPRARLLVVAGLTALVGGSLGGCSGSGQVPGEVDGDSLYTLATNHLSAVMTLGGWLKVFYMPVGDVDPHREVDPLTHQIRIWGELPDGGVFEYLIDPDDSSSTGGIRWPDGSEFRQVCGPKLWRDDHTTSHQHMTSKYPNGAELILAVNTHDGPTVTSTWRGMAVLPNGQRLHFHVERNSGVRDDLVLDLSDGCRLKASIPLSGDDIDYARQTSGRYRSAAGDSFNLWLSGTTRWESMTIATPNRLMTGAFTLGAELEGAGQFRRGASIAAALWWDEAGHGVLDVLDIRQQEVTPSAAALDCRIDQWTETAVRLGPTPMW